MKKDVKVSFFLKKNEKKKDGTCPIMAKLTIGQSSQTFFSAKISIAENLWKSGRAEGKSQKVNEINLELDEIRASAISHYNELSAVRNKVTAEDVKFLVLGMAFGQETLLSYFRVHNENFDKRVGVNRAKGTALSYWNTFNHLTTFLDEKYNVTDIPFSALDRSFIDKFDFYLRIECGLAPGTIVLLTTRLNTIIGNAVADGVLSRFPFAGYVAQRPKPIQKYLTRKELDKLMQTPLKRSNQYLVRDLFLFSCYTGIPYCDMRKLSGEDISTAADGVVWIKTSRKKTGVDYDVPLLDLPLQILNRYKGTAADGRLLPSYSLSHINNVLKEIARICGIKRKLSYHVARHTYASEITLSQGVPIETVSRMLGHIEITTTQIYAKVTNDKIDEDMKALEQRIAGRFKFAI